MKKGTIIWLSLATAFVLIGCIIFAGAMSTVNWDLSKLSTSKYETNTYEITEDFKNISINTETADVKFVLANNDKCTVECYEDKKLKHSAKVNDGTLCIDVDNNKSWYDFISFNFTSPKLTVYLPEKEYISLLVNESTGNVEVSDAFKFENVNISVSTGSVNFAADVNNLLKIKSSTGDICVENIAASLVELTATTGRVSMAYVTCDDAKVDVTTGKADLSNVKCRNLTSTGSTGKLTLTDVIATGTITADRSTGNIYLERSDAAQLFLETSTGNIEGSLLTDKVFITETSIGSADVPKTVTGGRCELKTSIGDIKITVE